MNVLSKVVQNLKILKINMSKSIISSKEGFHPLLSSGDWPVRLVVAAGMCDNTCGTSCQQLLGVC